MKRIIDFQNPKKYILVLYLLSIIVAFGLNGYLKYNNNMNNTVFMTVLGLVFAVISLLIFKISSYKQNQFVFICIFIAGLAAAVSSKSYNGYIIPIIGLLILFYILSDKIISLYSFLIIALLIAINSDNSFCLLVFIPSGIMLTFFLEISECKSIVLPVLSSNLLSALIYSFLLLISEEAFNAEMIVFPSTGIVLSIVISLITLFSYRRYFINKYEDISIQINDPEFFLLSKLKSTNAEEYKLAIHTAYLCDRISSLLNYDRILAKCLGYYHRIGILEEGKVSVNTLKIAKDNSFPPTLFKELEYYYGNGRKYPVSNELTVLCFSTEVIRSILIFIKNYPERKVDYDTIIDKIFEIKIQNSTLKLSKMKSEDLYKMKQYLKDEKLYYDFLR